MLVEQSNFILSDWENGSNLTSLFRLCQLYHQLCYPYLSPCSLDSLVTCQVTTYNIINYSLVFLISLLCLMFLKLVHSCLLLMLSHIGLFTSVGSIILNVDSLFSLCVLLQASMVLNVVYLVLSSQIKRSGVLESSHFFSDFCYPFVI